MLNRKIDWTKPLKAVVYARMSSTRQNARSPDQQIDEIRRRLKLLNRPWEIVTVYRDDAKSGRLIRQRKQFQQMLRAIRSGTMQLDVILVDTFERLGRNRELRTLRQELYTKHGVVILTADTDFADPTTSQGELYETISAYRATEDNRSKAHQVLRGKRDLAKRGFWTGGPRPFGFRLVPRTTERNGVAVVEGSVLEPLAEEAAVIQLLFHRALETGHGQTLLTKFLNGQPGIPADRKPFNSATVGTWLDQELYKGELVWPKLCTDIIDDVRRVEQVPEQEQIRLPDYCEPLVDPEDWDAVQAVRNRRRRSAPADTGKIIDPLSPGMSVKYALSGLVRCECGASMSPTKASGERSNGGEYTYFRCPRAVDGNCDNHRYVPEGWLWDVVAETIRQRVFFS